MVCAFVKKSKGSPPTWKQLEHAIRRNFDGMDSVNPVEVFSGALQNMVNRNEQVTVDGQFTGYRTNGRLCLQ